MNREKRETHKKVLFAKLNMTVLWMLLVNFGPYPKTEIIGIANTNFRAFRAFRG